MQAEDSVDLIDIGPLFLDDPKAQADCDAALWDGLKRTGSVVITGYPDAERIDVRARRGLEIFGFPDRERRALTTKLVEPGNPNYYRGYWPCTPDRLLKNDFFDVGPPKPAPGPDLPGMDILTEPTPWPEHRPDWVADVQAHYLHLNMVAQALIRSIGRSAGFDEATIANRFEGMHSTLRFLDYAAGAGSETGWSAGRHTDASGLSLLWQNTPGLEAEGQDGTWRSIPMMPDAISIHVGDVMTRLTDGIVPATPHRVRACRDPRQSVGFFLEPALSAPVTPANHAGETTIKDSYGWQLLKTFADRPHWKGVVRDPELA